MTDAGTQTTPSPAKPPESTRTGRPRTAATAVLAGICLAGSVPPWGWWPLAFIGIALVDRLINVNSARSRFLRMWVVAMAWLYPAMLWMWDLTAPGYVVAGAFYSAYFGLAAVATPPNARRLVLPGTFALAEWARWSWPFGGVPLANMALSQVDSPLIYPARIGGPLLVVVAVVVVGQALSAAFDQQWRPVAIGVAAVAVATLAGFAHPRADVVDRVEALLVQGGGPQRTRASSSQEPVVLARHIEATLAAAAASEADGSPGPDLVIWPENVVNPGRYLNQDRAYQEVVDVARQVDAPVLAGWFEPVSDTVSANYQSVITPAGDETDVYDKVQIVPFGEYVPLRGLIESLAPDSGLPARDLRRGEVEPVLDTDRGPVGVSISWEGYFEHRARHSVREGAQLLTNPTNGSSYWLTQVQTQQVASNQLRAMENDRWVLQVAPTGLSAVINPDGNLLQRTGVSERSALAATVEMRSGRTLASYVGPWPVVIYGLLAAGLGLVVGRRRRAD